MAEAITERQTFPAMFPPDEVEAEFTRLREESDPRLPPAEPAADPEPEAVVPVEVFEQMGVDPREMARVLREHPDIEALLPHAQPRTDDQIRENVIATARLKDGADARAELYGRDVSEAMQAVTEAVEDWDDEAAHERLTELYELAKGRDDGDVGEFLSDLRETEDGDYAQVIDSWAVQQKLRDDNLGLLRQVLTENQRIEAEAAAEQARQQAIAEAAETVKGRHKDWDKVAPEMAELLAADPAVLRNLPADEAEERIESLYRGAAELRRVESEAKIRQAIMGTTPSLWDGHTTVRGEPEWSPRPIEPKIRPANVAPKKTNAEAVADFRTFLHDDPVRDEFARLRRESR